MRSTPIHAAPSHLRAIFLALILATAAPAIPDAAAQTTTPLQDVVREALSGNPEIRAAGRERDAARQRIAPAGALDDPMLEAGALNVPANSWRLDREDMTMKMIGLAQRFPYPGKRGLRQDVAARGAESVEHGYHETINRVARDARLGYLDLGLVIETTKLTESNKLLLEQFLKLAESRYAVGQGGQADVLKAQTQLSRMMDELIKLARERPTIEAELNRVLGRRMGAPAPLPEAPQLRAVSLPLDALRDTALSQRPQLLALQSVAARNERVLELARKDSYPDFDVRLSYGQRDSMPDGTRRSDLVSFTVAINLPVWRESKITPRIAEAQAMHEQALDLYEVQRNEVVTKLRQQVASAEQNLRSARLYQGGILPQARLTVEASLAAYRVNRVDVVTLLDNQMTVFNYELAYATAVVNYNKALAEIDWLTGKPPL